MNTAVVCENPVSVRPGSRRTQPVARLLYAGWLAVLAFALAFVDAAAHGEDTSDGVTVKEVIGNVGDVSFPIRCTGPHARETFERGLALLHHMTYEVAEQEFAKVAAGDPKCAMAHWGIAITLVHPLWPGQPDQQILARGRSEIERARALAKTPRERAYIEALAAFYDDSESVDHATRIRRWESAQTALAERYPKDDEALALSALLRIAAAPKEDLTYAAHREVGARLEALGQRRPHHPAAIHYLIHAYDNPPLAEHALDAARRYDAIAPEVPHALHMPSHIFTRLGLWRESAAWNTRSREAARKLLVDDAIYIEFAHASDYLTYAYLQAGQDADARKARDNLFAAARVQDGFIAAYAYAAVATRIEMELGDWERAAAIVPRRPENISWDACAACEAIVHFARGVGAARSDQLEAARASAARLSEFAEKLQADGLAYWAKQVRAQQLTVEAWIHHAQGRSAEALRTMASAAEAEDALDKHPVTPGAVVPARELYADMLFAAGRFDDALVAYEATMKISPNRFNSLAGAGRAAEAAQRTDEARRYFARLLEIAPAADTTRPGLARAKAMLASSDHESVEDSSYESTISAAEARRRHP